MKLMKLCLLVAVMACLMVACDTDRGHEIIIPTEPAQFPALQGIHGTIEFWEGDFMPIVSPNNPSGTVTAVVRTIYFFEPTGNDDVVRDAYGSFFVAINSKLIDTVRSDSEGRFAITLPAGLYSLFVKEGDLYYANGSSDQHIQPVRVTAGQLSETRIKIDYLATY